MTSALGTDIERWAASAIAAVKRPRSGFVLRDHADRAGAEFGHVGSSCLSCRRVRQLGVMDGPNCGVAPVRHRGW